jgi:N6-adenosine-specific RNA methylase IME4
MKFRTIVADPPWPITWTTPKTRVNGRGERHTNYSRKLPYPTMKIEEISALKVETLAEADSHLFLWCIDRFVIDGSAAEVARKWGFEPKRLLVWHKTGFGLGTFPRPQHELCLIATRGRLPFNLKNIGSVQKWRLTYERKGSSAGRKHSAKPEGFYELIENASPGPFIELFARKAREGWKTWGNECPCDVELLKGEYGA